MILILTNNYPSENNLYANGFVHTRVLEYLENNIDINVFVCNKKKEKSFYNYQNVPVFTGNAQCLSRYLKNNKIEKICIHFLSPEMIKGIQESNQNYELFIFIHGNEALFWYERLFKSTTSFIHNFLVICHNSIFNTYSIINIRNFLKKSKHNFHFIAVSEWMMNKACKNWKINEKQFTIIPNYINKNLFFRKEKDESDRLKVLSIRPFSSSKYANDLSIEFILKLSKYDFFNELEFKIIGQGNMFHDLTSKIKSFKNVSLENRFLNQHEIKEYHDKYGIFLCPTRQDAQGVSMCEAISSGLVPITLYNTAIPEFVKESYILSKNLDEMIDKFILLYKNPSIFLNLSKNLSDSIHNQCGYESTIKKEIELVLGVHK